jgi:hypothetical protein
MLKWFPKDLIKKYGGHTSFSVASDDSLYLLAEYANRSPPICGREGTLSSLLQSTSSEGV